MQQANIAAVAIVRIPWQKIFVFLYGVLVALWTLDDPNKVHHIMQPKHGFKPGICDIECVKKSLEAGVEGARVLYSCLIETPGKIVKDHFHTRTSYHIGPCKE